MHSWTDEIVLLCKGAYEEMIPLCSRVRVGSHTVNLNDETRAIIDGCISNLLDEGLRVLVVATRPLSSSQVTETSPIENLEANMTLEGYLAFRDSPREDAAASIWSLQSLGVDIRVLTGDSLEVAGRLCQKLDIVRSVDDGQRRGIIGADLEGLDDVQLDQVLESCVIFAKLTPVQKARITGRLRKKGHCVGMLGDGVNDCSALQNADVAISISSSSNAAKDCSDGEYIAT
ncbi:hypothetical protein EYZ11_005393 [Aspergillus tanneri]|nr:hypothetical protein EYZ11_005393 [Aspergillus tanneri]